MIKSESIDELIAQLDILQVIGSSVELKKKGTSHTGKCPFHNEKSGSFHVSEQKQIFKCFGCGEGGGPVAYIMKKENIEFLPAIRMLASRINFTLEETEETPEEKEFAAKKADLYKINTAAAKHYTENLLKLNEEAQISGNQADSFWGIRHLQEDRNYTMDTILTYGLGFAPNSWDFILSKVREIGLYYPAEELGLVKSNEDAKTYDVFRDRIIFPIHNEHGLIVGFGGRKSPTDDKDSPKYLNSKDSPLYKKERVLYGLYQAIKAIKETGYAILVEGYTDVLSMHQGGSPNTVAGCGTAFTEHHAKLLKRYTNNVVLMGDGDEAGRKFNFRAMDILLKEGFRVDILPMEDKEDPDTFSRKYFVKAKK